MTFQYFFFDTYPGYFLQMLPLALPVGIIAGVIRYRRCKSLHKSVWFGVLAAYLAGLIGLTLLFDLIGDLWFRLLYGMESGRRLQLWIWQYNLIPDFWRYIRSETIANMFLYVPFGILYPMALRPVTLRSTFGAGVLWVLGIELIQPIFGRAFDINDIILNLGGIGVAAVLFYKLKR